MAILLVRSLIFEAICQIMKQRVSRIIRQCQLYRSKITNEETNFEMKNIISYNITRSDVYVIDVFIRCSGAYSIRV